MTSPPSTFRCTLCVLMAVCTTVAATAVNADSANRNPNPTTGRAAKTHSVKVKGMKFSPATLKIKVGETVVWTNADDHDHTIVADDKSFKSGNLRGDDSFENAFNQTGTFKYGCKYHPRERGTITVEK